MMMMMQLCSLGYWYFEGDAQDDIAAPAVVCYLHHPLFYLSLSTRSVGKEVRTYLEYCLDLYLWKIRDVHREVGRYNFYHQTETKVRAN